MEKCWNTLLLSLLYNLAQINWGWLLEVTFLPFCNPRPWALRPVGWVTTDEWLPDNALLSRSQWWLALLQSLKTPKYGILEAGRLSRDHGVFSPLLFAQTAGSLDLDCFKRSASHYLGCIDEGAIKKQRPISRMGKKAFSQPVFNLRALSVLVRQLLLISTSRNWRTLSQEYLKHVNVWCQNDLLHREQWT